MADKLDQMSYLWKMLYLHNVAEKACNRMGSWLEAPLSWSNVLNVVLNIADHRKVIALLHETKPLGVVVEVESKTVKCVNWKIEALSPVDMLQARDARSPVADKTIALWALVDIAEYGSSCSTLRMHLMRLAEGAPWDTTYGVLAMEVQ